MSHRLTKKQKEEIKELYIAGSSPSEIGKIYNIFSNSVTRMMKKMNVPRNQCVRLTKDQENIIIKQYLEDKLSSPIIANNLGIYDSTVLRVLKRNNIELRENIRNHKYEKNDNFFEIIDNEEKAYFLGLMYADGNVSNRNYQITITLEPNSKDILNKFSQIIFGFEKLYKDTRSNGKFYWGFSFSSEKMHKDLCKLGCMPNKTFKIKFPSYDDVPKELIHHFIRGYFDGDGCVSLADESRPRLDFTSNKMFIDGLIAHLESTIDIKCNKPGKFKNTLTSNIQFGSHDDVLKMLHYMYDGATIFLQRKKDNAIRAFGLILERKSRRQNDVSKYGTHYVPTFNGILLNKGGLRNLSDDDKKSAVPFLFDHFKKGGFPYTNLCDDDLIHQFNLLKKSNNDTILKSNNIIKLINRSAVDIFKHFSPHFWNVNSMNSGKPSMIEAFHDDTKLIKVIKNRLSYNSNMNGNSIKQGLSASYTAFKASTFLPSVAKLIYSRYLIDGDITYDYSMGFGQRLLGAMSLPFNVKYIGIDPWEPSINSNNNIYEFLNKNNLTKNTVDIHKVGSENFRPEQYIKKVKLAFSSPPYYNLEKYSNEDSQAYSKGYSYFIQSWWRKTVENIDQLLMKDGIFAINIANVVYNGSMSFNLKEDMTVIINEFGYKQIDEYNMQLTSNKEFHDRKELKFEPILIFQK